MKTIYLFFFFLIVYSTSGLHLFAQNDDVTSPSAQEKRTLKLSPQVRIIKRKRTIPTLKMEIIQHFLNRPKIVTPEEIEDAGYIIASTQPSIFVTQGNRIYASNLEKGIVGERYVIVRLGQAYRDPLEGEEGDVLAYEGINLGEAILKVPGDPAILDVTTANREMKKGDHLLLTEAQGFPEDFYLHSPEILEEAYIIATVDGILSFGQYQIVVINKGLDDDLERGHVLAINKRSRVIQGSFFEEEIRVPRQKVGTLLVFRVFNHVSYALVMEADVPLNLLDEVSVP